MKETKNQIEDKHQQPDMNFFRGNYAGNKSTDKESYFFSSRAKEDIVKAKPKLLTGRLPPAFNVQGERKESEGDNAKKVLPINNSIDQRERYSTEGNVKQQKYKLLYKDRIDLLNQFNSDNSDNEKTNCLKQNNTSSTRPKTESDVDNYDKGVFNNNKPVYPRGSSANSHKVKSIGNNIALNPSKDYNPSKNNKAHHSSDVNMSKTQKLLPKIMMEETDRSNVGTGSNNKAIVKNRMVKDTKLKQFALEDGFTYYSNKTLKHYFHVPLLQLYFIKEVKYDSRIIEQIKQWQRDTQFNDNTRSSSYYLNINHYFINNPEGQISILIEYPFGLSINEITNSTGIASNYLLNKIARNCLNILSSHNKGSNNNDTNNSQDYGIYCQCDLFYNSIGELKIMPNILLNEQIDSYSQCECKLFLYKLQKSFKLKLSQYFSLGFILLKCLTGNIELKVYDLLFQQSINIKLKCCLMHTLLSIEDNYLSKDHHALLSHFLISLPSNCIQIICELLSFNTNTKPNYCNSWLNSIAKQRMALKINELLRISYEDNIKEQYIDQFIHKFNMVIMNLEGLIDINQLIQDFKAKKMEIEAICRLYDINTNSLIDQIKESIIANNLCQYK